MIKWIIALAAALVFGQGTPAAVQNLSMYTEYLLALGVALAIQPWVVAQFEG